MSRVQLALNVSDIDSAVDFYSKLFGDVPAKRRPGYANFAIASPPLKLVLIESDEVRADGVAGALNHLGIEVDSAEEVRAAATRLDWEGLAPEVQENTTHGDDDVCSFGCLVGERLWELTCRIETPLREYLHHRRVQGVGRIGARGLDTQAASCVVIEQRTGRQAPPGVVNAEEQHDGFVAHEPSRVGAWCGNMMSAASAAVMSG